MDYNITYTFVIVLVVLVFFKHIKLEITILKDQKQV